MLSAAGIVTGWWGYETALSLFLLAYFANGTLQLTFYLLRHKPLVADLRLNYLHETGRSNLALGASTLLLGSFDKIALALRPTLGGIESAYLIADRLTGVYGTVMNYYTQSRVQSAISRKSWVDRQALRMIDIWFWRGVPSVLLFGLIGGLFMALLGPPLRLNAEPAFVAGCVMAICLMLHLKNSSGYAIRLLDATRSHKSFNITALTLILSALIGLVLCVRAEIEIIVFIKLALHLLLLHLLRRGAIKEEGIA
jgi:hypothetical protein